VEGVPGPDLVLVQARLPLPCWWHSSTGHRFPVTMTRAGRVTGRSCGLARLGCQGTGDGAMLPVLVFCPPTQGRVVLALAVGDAEPVGVAVGVGVSDVEGVGLALVVGVGAPRIPVRGLATLLISGGPLSIWRQDSRVSRRGKHPATRPSRSASSADRASSATVAAATAASCSCLTTRHDRGSRTSPRSSI
jgi:hypothetical protein